LHFAQRFDERGADAQTDKARGQSASQQQASALKKCACASALALYAEQALVGRALQYIFQPAEACCGWRLAAGFVV